MCRERAGLTARPLFVRSARGLEASFAISFNACGPMGSSPHAPK